MKRARYSDIVRYSDVKENAIEIPRIFAESMNPWDIVIFNSGHLKDERRDLAPAAH
jgi:hypothetical protein